MIRTLTLFLLFAPFSATAELQPAVAELMLYMDVTATCFDGAEDSDEAGACVGHGSTVCMETETHGYTTVGMMFCTLAEYEAWDRLLNRDYGPMMDGMRRLDAEDAEFFPEFANRAEALRDAQRAWIPLRDAQCALEHASGVADQCARLQVCPACLISRPNARFTCVSWTKACAND